MDQIFHKLSAGQRQFEQRYATGTDALMPHLCAQPQRPKIMLIACCDSRVDPALVLGYEPGDVFSVRSIACIVPPYAAPENSTTVCSTSAALEYGICHLHVEHLILMGHSQCGGVQALTNHDATQPRTFISGWVSTLSAEGMDKHEGDQCTKQVLIQSRQNCLTFPWIKERVEKQTLQLHTWFFDMATGKVYTRAQGSDDYQPLSDAV